MGPDLREHESMTKKFRIGFFITLISAINFSFTSAWAQPPAGLYEEALAHHVYLRISSYKNVDNALADLSPYRTPDEMKWLDANIAEKRTTMWPMIEEK